MKIVYIMYYKQICIWTCSSNYSSNFFSLLKGLLSIAGMFPILVVVKNGEAMELVMIYIPLDLMELPYGQVLVHNNFINMSWFLCT